jgi:type I restriction enzyme, S subunit
LDGAIVSSHYFLFEIDEAKLDRRFLDYYVRTPSFRDQVTAQGSTNYAAVRPNEVLGYRLPLPPLEEQRRIVARIEELTVKIEEARGLREEVVRELGNLLPRTLSQILNSNRWESRLLEKVLAESPRNGLAPQVEVADGEVAMLRINAVSSSPTRFVDTAACKMISVTSEVAEPFTLKNDDVFIVRYNGDINRVAKAAVFKSQEPVKIVYPDKLMRLRPDRSKMTPDFLVYALGRQSVRLQIEEMGKTTAGQIGVSGKDAKSFRIPVPPLEEQYRIVAYLDNLQAKVDALKKLQAETAAELNALLPSILDKAFKGEL